MKIDCATCPGRNRACDGCLMQVLFDPMSRDFGPSREVGGPDRELLDAVTVLAATQLISPSVAQTAKSRIDTGQSAEWAIARPHLRAV
ncbi:hypothetical protein [Gordonia sp. (in: high G+C Gram-positive bacteria)]|uniref:hypothetical protein n=1 Tax=Gordonia sp. (in: high G+C Gram-positive bacteria) TaxID=84139 RepID=UPI003BB78E2C